MPRTAARAVPGFSVHLQPGDTPAIVLRKASLAKRTYLSAVAMAQAQAGAVIDGRLAFGAAVRTVRGAA